MIIKHTNLDLSPSTVENIVNHTSKLCRNATEFSQSKLDTEGPQKRVVFMP